MTYTYQLIDNEYYYQILDGKKIRKTGKFPATVADIEALLEVLTTDEEVLKDREGQPL